MRPAGRAPGRRSRRSARQSAAHLLVGDGVRPDGPYGTSGLRSAAAGDGRRHGGPGLRRPSPVLAHRPHDYYTRRSPARRSSPRSSCASARARDSASRRRAPGVIACGPAPSRLPGAGDGVSRDADLSHVPGWTGGLFLRAAISRLDQALKALGREDFAASALRLLARAAGQRGRAHAAARVGVSVQVPRRVAPHPGRLRHSRRRHPDTPRVHARPRGAPPQDGRDV